MATRPPPLGVDHPTVVPANFNGDDERDPRPDHTDSTDDPR